jgi:hypothetical protein
MDEESTVRRVIPPGINSSGTKNPPKVWDSARNYQLMNKESTQLVSAGNDMRLDADSDR